MLNRTLLIGLFATTALATHALAQQATGSQQTTDETVAPTSQVGEIVVTARQVSGGGQMVAADGNQVVETISKEYIASQFPSASPALLIQNLPSVNVSNSDAFGLNGGTNVQIHGLNSFDLGFVIDGAPVYNSGSGYSNETIDAHDLTTATITPGSSTLDAPTIGSAAGTLYLTMRDPSHKGGGAFDVAGGTQSFNMEYFRLDSGDIGNTNTRGFISLSHTYADQWRGGGYNNKWHLDSKIVKDFDGGSRLSFEASVNRQTYTYYYYPTANQFANYNADFNQFNTHQTYQGFGDTSFYKLNQQKPSYAMVFLAPIHIVASDKIVIDDTPYFWAFIGGGSGGNVLRQGSTFQGTQPANVDLTNGGKIPLTDGQALVDTGFKSNTYEIGNVAKVTAKLGANTFIGGWWHEHYINYERDPVTMVNQATGDLVNPLDPAGHYHLANGKTYYYNNSNMIYNLDSLFLGDTLSLIDNKLKLGAGFKYVSLRSNVDNFLPGAIPFNKQRFHKFLPQFQAKYDIDEKNSIYADVEKDFRQPFLFSVVDYYSVQSGLQQSAASNAIPETAVKEELGYRYKGSLILADISLFNINLKNHLLTLTEIINGEYVSSTANVGNQRSRGVDLQIGANAIDHFSPYFSFEYLDSRIESNVPVINQAGNPDFLPTKGKFSTQAPKFQAAAGLTYRNGPLLIGARARWVDKQYATLTNDESMPSYITDDFTISYDLPRFGPFSMPKAQLNMSNIGNRKYRTGVNFTPFNALDTVGTQGGIIASGGSPTYYIQPRFAAVFSLSSSF